MKWSKHFLSLALLLVAIAGAGCGKASDPKAAAEGSGDPLKDTRVAVFFADSQAQHLAPEEHLLPQRVGPEAQANEVLRLLLAGPTDPNLRRTLPAGVRLLEPVRLEEGTARVNLSRELLQVRGAAGVNMALGSLRLTLTDIPGIDWVQILVEGNTGAVLDEGVVLDYPMGRPFFGDVMVIPDPARVTYLQEKVNKGKETWRTDPARVLRFDGRMFGFTLQQLQMSRNLSDNTTMQARVYHRDDTYTVKLARNTAVKKNAVWTITAIVPDRLSGGQIILPLFFPDRQGLNVIPVSHSFPDNDRLPTAVMEALLAGPEDPYLRNPFPAGTRVRSVRVQGGLAIVDLSGELRQLQGSAESSQVIDALRYTFTQVPGIDQVQVLVEGEKGAVIGNYKLDRPMRIEVIQTQYWLDQERLAWLQGRVNEGLERWRLQASETLYWEGRTFGFPVDQLRTAKMEEQKDRAQALLAGKGRNYIIELARNPGNTGIWYITSIKMK